MEAEADSGLAFDQLTELENHPINLNSATREQLERLPFLSARQVGDLLEYVYRNKAMLSLSELLLVKSIGDDVRRLLHLAKGAIAVPTTSKAMLSGIEADIGTAPTCCSLPYPPCLVNQNHFISGRKNATSSAAIFWCCQSDGCHEAP